jgi:hypothetical protein
MTLNRANNKCARDCAIYYEFITILANMTKLIHRLSTLWGYRSCAQFEV